MGGHPTHDFFDHRNKGSAVNPLLSSLEGMAAMYMASQPGPHTAGSIREIIGQLRDTPMFSGKVSDAESEELARPLSADDDATI